MLRRGCVCVARRAVSAHNQHQHRHHHQFEASSAFVLRGVRHFSGVEVTKVLKLKSCGSKNTIEDKWKLPPPEVEQHMSELQQATRQHYRQANYSAALQSSEEMLECCVSNFGGEHPATASAHNDVGLMCKALGKYEEARESYHKALRIYGEVVGKDHASYAAALNNLGNLDRAIASTSPDDDDDDNDESNDNDESKNKRISALERLQLNESAIEYFEESYNIRRVELGPNHPHTITSRTNLGSALAAVVLDQQASLLNTARNTTHHKHKPYNNQALKTLSHPSKFTQKRWTEAERHLREALKTAIDNPTGQTANIKHNKPLTAPNNPKHKDRTKSKKQRRKEAKQSKKRSTNNTTTTETTTTTTTAPLNIIPTIQTLTAATAAQNLAVFLKLQSQIKSETFKTLNNSSSSSSSSTSPDFNEEYAEAHSLYKQTLQVRNALLPSHHPDVMATKFSLAELLEVLGDEKGAEKLRKEILDTYQIEERSHEEEKESAEGNKTKKD